MGIETKCSSKVVICGTNCNFLVIWGLKPNPHDLQPQVVKLQLPRYMGIETIFSLRLLTVLTNCNFLVIWGLKPVLSVFDSPLLFLLQLPRYMGIETIGWQDQPPFWSIATSSLYGDWNNFLNILLPQLDIATSSLYGDWNRKKLELETIKTKLQLPRYMGIETAPDNSTL